MRKRWLQGAAGLLLLMVGAQAGAQPVYRCPSANGVAYSNLPCSGGRPLVEKNRKVSERNAVPPQNRAKAARRAQLNPEDRRECSALDRSLPEQEALIRAKGSAVTADEERPLVKARLRFRELRC